MLSSFIFNARVSWMFFWGWFGLDLRNDGGQGQRVAIQKTQVLAKMLRVFQKWKVRLMGSWCSICNRTLPFCLQCPALVDWQILGPNWQLFLPPDLVHVWQTTFSNFPTLRTYQQWQGSTCLQGHCTSCTSTTSAGVPPITLSRKLRALVVLWLVFCLLLRSVLSPMSPTDLHYLVSRSPQIQVSNILAEMECQVDVDPKISWQVNVQPVWRVPGIEKTVSCPPANTFIECIFCSKGFVLNFPFLDCSNWFVSEKGYFLMFIIHTFLASAPISGIRTAHFQWTFDWVLWSSTGSIWLPNMLIAAHIGHSKTSAQMSWPKPSPSLLMVQIRYLGSCSYRDGRETSFSYSMVF